MVMAFRVWFACLVVASVVGYVVTVLTASADSGHDLFDSPVLLPSITVLAVMCGFAGWAVPRAGPWWGVVVAVPYLAGLLTQIAIGPDSAFAVLGVAILVILLLAPWLAGVIGSVASRRLRR
jgi:hypothetical protein